MAAYKYNTIENATGKWFGILSALGVDEKFLSNKHGPCILCGGVDRWRWDDREGSGSFYCNDCGAGYGIDLIMKINNWSFKHACEQVDSIIGTIGEAKVIKERSEEDKISSIKKVLKESRAIVKDDPVWKYLNMRTGIVHVPVDIRFHPRMVHPTGGNWPVMLSIMRNSKGEGVSVHRTYLTSDGVRAPVESSKLFMPGKPLNGSSVRLGDLAAHIGVSEGVETGIAYSLRYGIPMCAATSAGLMESWIVPAGVRKVTIASDNDASYTGQSAAYNLAKRLTKEGIKVNVECPEGENSDYADFPI